VESRISSVMYTTCAANASSMNQHNRQALCTRGNIHQIWEEGIVWSENTVQEVQLLCVGSSGSFSTEQEFHRVRNGNQESLYPQAHQSLDSTALPAHILKLNETKVAVGNQGNCKSTRLHKSTQDISEIWSSKR
jgi:hypothetical protein